MVSLSLEREWLLDRRFGSQSPKKASPRGPRFGRLGRMEEAWSWAGGGRTDRSDGDGCAIRYKISETNVTKKEVEI